MKDLARRLNFFTASFVGILGFSLIAEIFQEKDSEDKLDDVLILLLGVGAIVWYKKTGHKVSNAVGSAIILGLGILVKLIGVYIERSDKEALGDDIGILVALLLAFIFVLWQIFLHKKAK
jgi:hypothetical protein